MEFLENLYYRIIAAAMVMMGKAVPIPVYDSDMSIVVLETEGSQVNYLSIKNIVSEDNSYNLQLSKIILWACSKNRFFWKADPIGIELKGLADEAFEEHKKES